MAPKLTMHDFQDKYLEKRPSNTTWFTHHFRQVLAHVYLFTLITSKCQCITIFNAPIYACCRYDSVGMIEEDSEHYHCIWYLSRGHKWNEDIRNFIKKISGLKLKQDLSPHLLPTQEAILRRSGLITAHDQSLEEVATALVSPVDYQVSPSSYTLCIKITRNFTLHALCL